MTLFRPLLGGIGGDESQARGIAWPFGSGENLERKNDSGTRMTRDVALPPCDLFKCQHWLLSPDRSAWKPKKHWHTIDLGVYLVKNFGITCEKVTAELRMCSLAIRSFDCKFLSGENRR